MQTSVFICQRSSRSWFVHVVDEDCLFKHGVRKASGFVGEEFALDDLDEGFAADPATNHDFCPDIAASDGFLPPPLDILRHQRGVT